jgi:hypothetical protein
VILSGGFENVLRVILLPSYAEPALHVKPKGHLIQSQMVEFLFELPHF